MKSRVLLVVPGLLVSATVLAHQSGDTTVQDGVVQLPGVKSMRWSQTNLEVWRLRLCNV